MVHSVYVRHGYILTGIMKISSWKILAVHSLSQVLICQCCHGRFFCFMFNHLIGYLHFAVFHLVPIDCCSAVSIDHMTTKIGITKRNLLKGNAPILKKKKTFFDKESKDKEDRKWWQSDGGACF